MKRKLTIITGMVFVLATMLFQTSGCGTGQPSSADAELEQNLKLWQKSHITDYNFEMVRYAGGMSAWVPVSVKVRAGKALSVEPARERLELEKINGYDDFNTVEKCFERIREGYGRGEKIKVTYNKQLGYPEKITFELDQGVDAFYSINISKFEATKN